MTVTITRLSAGLAIKIEASVPEDEGLLPKRMRGLLKVGVGATDTLILKTVLPNDHAHKIALLIDEAQTVGLDTLLDVAASVVSARLRGAQ